jgi:hypothetical protein
MGTISNNIRLLEPENRLAIQLSVIQEIHDYNNKSESINTVKRYLRMKSITPELKRVLLYKLWILKNYPIIRDIRFIKIEEVSMFKKLKEKVSIPRIIAAAFMCFVIYVSCFIMMSLLFSCSSGPQQTYEIGSDFVIKADERGNKVEYYDCKDNCYIEISGH